MQPETNTPKKRRSWRLVNPEGAKKASARWREKHGAAWREANHERARQHQLAYRNKNKERCREANRRYRKSPKYDAKKRAPSASPERKAYLYEYCQRRNASKLLATPRWASAGAMRAIYARAAELRRQGQDVHVDHIVPLRSDLVCGLHCEANLQILPAAENHRKLNLVWPDMPA